MKRVLVTGASGFIGRHSLPHLAARGFEVHAVMHKGSLPECAVRCGIAATCSMARLFASF